MITLTLIYLCKKYFFDKKKKVIVLARPEIIVASLRSH